MTIKNIEELFVHDGRDFVTEAYINLLKREPDEHGLMYYLGRLAQGHSKSEVIAQLAQSSECCPHDDINGLKKLIHNNKHARHWFWGRLSSKKRFGQNLNSVLYSLTQQQNIEKSSTEKSFTLLINAVQTHNEILNNLVHEVVRIQENTKTEATESFIANPDHRYILNLTTSNNWRAHPVGIVRVERELAKFLFAYKNIDYAIWDDEALILRKLERWQVRNILSEKWCDNNKNQLSYQSSSLHAFDLSNMDAFISVGLDWDNSQIYKIYNHLVKYGSKLVAACHDLVPIIYPEFTVRRDFDQLFKKHLIDIAHTATVVWVSSDSIRSSLIDFWISAGVDAHLPEVCIVPLASLVFSEIPQLSNNDANTLQHTLSRGDYVLYVSSLEARKNHRLLVNVWRELHRKRGSLCPRLVFVGMRGWGTDDLLSQIGRMKVFKEDKITWLEGVSDALLYHLYTNCLFTVFPSTYEGWGLAATESLSHGKICIVANNSALPEATQGLMPQYHPYDYMGWSAEIARLVDDHLYRLTLEESIVENYVNRSWADFSREYCEKVLSNQARHKIIGITENE